MTAPALILTSLVTSGLRPNHDQPLELGLLAVARGTFEPVDQLVIPMRADVSAVLDAMDPKVAEMHSGNGLLDELVTGDVEFDSFDKAARAADLAAVEFVEKHGAAGDYPSPLLCFGTDWTHRWLAARFPELLKRFKGEIDLGLVARSFGNGRPPGATRAEATLFDLFTVLTSMSVGFAK